MADVMVPLDSDIASALAAPWTVRVRKLVIPTVVAAMVAVYFGWFRSRSTFGDRPNDRSLAVFIVLLFPATLQRDYLRAGHAVANALRAQGRMHRAGPKLRLAYRLGRFLRRILPRSRHGLQ